MHQQHIPSTVRRTTARTAAAGAATLLAVLAPAAAAQAHVRVTPTTAAPGSYATLTFKVPTESATASTDRLVLTLPTDHPFGSVSYQPVPGWSVQVTTSKLATPIKTDDATITEAPTRITWTASTSAARIAPGQFQTFAISVGPVPDVGSLKLSAQQTYTDGSVVNWDESTPSSGAEPEHPAPMLYIKSAPPGGSAASATGAADPAATVAAAPRQATTASGDSSGQWLGVAGIGVGAVALVVAAYALTRIRSAKA
ncbi:YcnI family protein [Allobranchiibius huperziae]|uniref:Uncharacterized protein YcnI n=1 Tax=Allobranchiibius huperziae TaxID=1874116 RepID=A0A853DI17_9MICO|nr:YcnI family protein [Allobranchiibius huperziae]NYJ74684.1 uncharacterized protein YcnI [Allobranchiibius huperziae]